MRDDLLDFGVRTREHVDRDQLADPPRGGGARIRCGLYRADVAADDSGHEAVVDLLTADEEDLGCLDHPDGGLHQDHQHARIDNADRVAAHIVLGCQAVSL